MNVTVLGITEGRAVDAAGRSTKILVMTYKVGSLGPFTLETNAAEISSGAALQRAQAFAQAINTLPMAGS